MDGRPRESLSAAHELYSIMYTVVNISRRATYKQPPEVQDSTVHTSPQNTPSPVRHVLFSSASVRARRPSASPACSRVAQSAVRPHRRGGVGGLAAARSIIACSSTSRSRYGSRAYGIFASTISRAVMPSHSVYSDSSTSTRKVGEAPYWSSCDERTRRAVRGERGHAEWAGHCACSRPLRLACVSLLTRRAHEAWPKTQA